MVKFIKAKTILSSIKGEPDPYFGIKYNMNLYRGCQHQCIYCDSRSTCYQLGDLREIRAKENALELLEKELKGKKIKGTIGTGSMNDPYMPVENELKLTRRALEVIARYKFPVHIITKGALVARDADVLQKIQSVYAAVSFTITAASDELSKKIEPAAPASSERFLAMESLAKQNIYTGIIISPVLPWITDSWANIEQLVMQAKKSGAQYILAWFGTTQREGQREWFYNELNNKFPGLKEKYETRFKNDYSCPSPNYKELYSKFLNLCNKLQMPVKMNFFQPSNNNSQLSLF